MNNHVISQSEPLPAHQDKPASEGPQEATLSKLSEHANLKSAELPLSVPAGRGINYTLVLDAISYSARIHRGQTRADAATPYAAHPFRVLTLLALVFGVKDEEILATAVLHDTIEDTEANYDKLAKRFGKRVADGVAELTKDMRLPKKQREQQFLNDFEHLSVGVKLIKLADMLDNLIDTEAIDNDKLSSIVAKAHAIIDSISPVQREAVIVQKAVDEVQSQL